MRVRTKIWLETDGGRPVLGDGRFEILEAIGRTGSLSAAARELGMSYRALWGKVRTAEERLGVPLVRGTAGGEHHGGSTLTDEAVALVAAFAAFRAQAEKAVDKLAAKALRGLILGFACLALGASATACGSSAPATCDDEVFALCGEVREQCQDEAAVQDTDSDGVLDDVDYMMCEYEYCSCFEENDCPEVSRDHCDG